MVVVALFLKDKSGVGKIVDHSRDNTVVNSVVYFSFFPFNLRNYIFQSAKKCEMTSFSIPSPQCDLNEASKCVDTLYHSPIHTASLLIAPSRTTTKYKMATIFRLTYQHSLTNL